MSHENEVLRQLANRLERLERQNRRWKLATFATALLVYLCVTLGADQAKQPKVVETEEFIVRDAKGVKRVEIGSEGFFINNDDGKHRISIFSSKDGGTGVFLFADDTYKKQVGMGIQDKLNFCGFNVNDDKGTNRIFITTVANKPKLELQDETGKPFFSHAQP